MVNEKHLSRRLTIFFCSLASFLPSPASFLTWVGEFVKSEWWLDAQDEAPDSSCSSVDPWSWNSSSRPSSSPPPPKTWAVEWKDADLRTGKAALLFLEYTISSWFFRWHFFPFVNHPPHPLEGIFRILTHGFGYRFPYSPIASLSDSWQLFSPILFSALRRLLSWDRNFFAFSNFEIRLRGKTKRKRFDCFRRFRFF